MSSVFDPYGIRLSSVCHTNVIHIFHDRNMYANDLRIQKHKNGDFVLLLQIIIRIVYGYGQFMTNTWKNYLKQYKL